MQIYNTRIEIMVEARNPNSLLDQVTASLTEKFGELPLRFAIVDAKKNKLVVEATVVGE